MYERIVAAIDDSPRAERVLAAAEELARLSTGEVFVLHVWERQLPKDPTSPVMSCEDAQLMVKRAAEKLSEAGIRASAEVAVNMRNHAAREITGYARELDAGVIVIGSRRRGDITALIAGSTAHKVVHNADRPVIVVS
jgi:nucleotide-binding universal stress UspA family protein